VVEVSGALRSHPRLVESAVAAATVALEHAQLQVELKARLGQVQVTHARIIEADVAARSRIERNLHDGAQQRLVALAMTLGAIEAANPDPAVQETIARCRRDVSAALQELRELARGIHPAELTQGGLLPALETAAERLGLRIALDVPDQRFPAAAESTMYLAICDGLADAVGRSAARAARISVAHEAGRLTAEIRTDADAGPPGTGYGPVGAATDRVRALGGDITITHDEAETTMKVAVPCEWPSPKTAE
jgi:signal transduction histidine kinase